MVKGVGKSGCISCSSAGVITAVVVVSACCLVVLGVFFSVGVTGLLEG
jgi:hypothetical protein